jgi:hypothetical protein
VWVYFKKPSVESDEQLRRVLEFRATLETGKDIFFREFSDTVEWEEMFREHLVAYLDGLKRWNLEANFTSMDKHYALLEGRFYGEGIFHYEGPLDFSIDLDGDGKDEEVHFSCHHGGAELVVSKFGSNLRFSVPTGDKVPQDEIPYYHVALKDVNNDGLAEVLVASQPSIGELVLAVFGFKSPDRKFERETFDLLAVLKGQFCAQVLEGG